MNSTTHQITALWQRDVATTASDVRHGRVSAVEGVEAALERIASQEPAVRAFCTLDEDGALDAARTIDLALRRGIDPGPLAGVPVAVKDLLNTAGLRTTFGSSHYREHVPNEDDVAVARLRNAGAIVIGKTTTSEFGYAPIGENAVVEAPRNPHDLRLTTGGSSAGSAAAVVYGGVPLALGSDGGGSVRIPAALCGATGFKPSMGRIPAWPSGKDERFPGLSSWDALEHIGPLTWTVADAYLAMRTLAGPDARDRFSLPGNPFDQPLESHWLAGKTVGLSIDYGFVPIEPEVRARVEEVAELMRTRFGCTIIRQDPGFDDPFEGFGALIAMESDLDGMRLLAESGRLSPYVMSVLDRAWTAEDFSKGRRTRQQVCRVMAEYMAGVDLMLTPTSPVTAFPRGGIGPTEIDGQSVDPAYWLSMTSPLNLTGQPAISLPAGTTASGLPIGVQLVGRHLADVELLSAAVDLESALADVHGTARIFPSA